MTDTDVIDHATVTQLGTAVREIHDDPQATNGHRRAAVALVALGEERAAAVLTELGEGEGAILAAEMLSLGPVSANEITDALDALMVSLDRISATAAPGERYTRAILTRAFGSASSSKILESLTRPEPFVWLAEADVDVAARVLAAEPPATIALALAHLGPKVGAQLLTRLPEDLRSDVAHRVASLATVDEETVATVDIALRERVGVTLRAPVHRIAGPGVLAEMLSASARKHEKNVISKLGEADPKLAEKVRAALFTFDDLALLPGRDLQRVLSQVEIGDLAVALVPVSDDIRLAVETNLSERARANLQEEASYLIGTRATDIRAAQGRVLAAVRQMEAEGIITLPRAGDDDEDEDDEA